MLDEFGWVDHFKTFEIPEDRADEMGVNVATFKFFEEKYQSLPLMLFDAHLRRDIAPDDIVDVVVTDLTVDEAMKLIAAFDYTTSLAEYDVDILADLIEASDATTPQFADLTNEISEFFELIESVDADVPEVEDVEAKEDRGAELAKEWQTAEGQIWQITGNVEHRLAIGDSTDDMVIERVLGSAIDAVDLVFTSPPYNLGKSVVLNQSQLSKSGNAYDTYDDDNPDWLGLMNGWFEASKIAVDFWVVNVQMLAGNKRELVEWINSHRDRLVDVCIWDKTSAPPAMAPNVMNSQFEFLLIFGEPGASRSISLANWRGTRPNVYAGPPQRHNVAADVNAATMPVHLPEFILTRLCDSAETVLDPFSGTGTTMLVADQLSRRSFNVELSVIQSAVSLQRMKDSGATVERIE